MPDCLEMPYKPKIIGATEPVKGKPVYRLGGNSCLSGDFMGDWSFDHELKPGERIVFLDMIHYTMVKTTTLMVFSIRPLVCGQKIKNLSSSEDSVTAITETGCLNKYMDRRYIINI
jgi:hypothetical protein